MPDPANLLGALALAVGDAQAAAGGLSDTALAVVNTLYVAPGSSIAALAEVTGRSHSVIVRTVEAVEAQGLVARQPGPDRRTASLVLTRAGEAARSALQSARLRALNAALAPLNDADRAEFARLAGQILSGLTESRVAGDRICRLCDEDACGPHCPVETRAVALEGLRP